MHTPFQECVRRVFDANVECRFQNGTACLKHAVGQPGELRPVRVEPTDGVTLPGFSRDGELWPSANAGMRLK